MQIIKTWAPILISALSLAISLYEFFSRKAKERTKVSISIDSEAGICSMLSRRSRDY